MDFVKNDTTTVESTADLYQSLSDMYIKTDDDMYLSLMETGIIHGSNIDFMLSQRLSKDAKIKMKEVSMKHPNKLEMSCWVKIYYQLQDYRKASRERIRALEKVADERGISKEDLNTDFNKLILQNAVIMETNMYDVLAIMVANDPVGHWLLQIQGVGVILAANLLSTFDVKNHPYVSHFASYCGYNDQNRPWLGKDKAEKLVDSVLNAERERLGKKTIVVTDEMVDEISVKSQWKFGYLRKNCYDPEKDKWSVTKLKKAIAKIPYNADAKVMMFKLTESFKYLANKEGSLYGRLYREAKIREMELNDSGAFAAEAERKLANTPGMSKKTESYKIYKSGKLPPAHIISRAKRKVGKIFLSHLFEEMYRMEFHKEAPRAWQFEYQSGLHNNIIEPEVPFDPI